MHTNMAPPHLMKGSDSMLLSEYAATVTADTTLVTTAETVLATLVIPSTPGPGTPVNIRGWAQITLGTGTTAVTMRVRRGADATGTLIGEANPEQIFTAAGSTESHSIEVRDAPGELANQSYVLTVAQTGASANGSVLQAKLEATVG
jgi:hypothetical protein